MRIVVVGSGGREHALAARLVAEGHEVVGAPGNPGISQLGRCVPAEPSDLDALTRAVSAERPTLVVVGPEAPLAAGLADRLHALDLRVFGPTARAARVEASKSYAKALMRRGGVPTAAFLTASDEAEADAAIARFGGRCAVKADGLAAGKGVVVCESESAAREAARAWLRRGPVLIEERLEGPELSVIALTDGRRLALLPPARDHKRLGEGDVGPNTGGMGAVCPVPLGPATLEQLRETILRPVLDALAADGAPFVGALYAGLMLTPEGPRVLEFNARLGDPETQAILAALSPRVNLAETLLAAAEGRLAEGLLPDSRAACAVVVASAGYPAAPRAGDELRGLDAAASSGAQVLHAGTRLEGGRLVSAGGRVVTVVGTGDALDEARRRANEAAERIELAGAQWRRDVGAAAV